MALRKFLTSPRPKPSERYNWRCKVDVLKRTWRLLGRIDLVVSLCLLVLEHCAWACERLCGSLYGWRVYHRLARTLLFRFYFRRVTVKDPFHVLRKAVETRIIFASNHPTGLFDRLLIQYISPLPCYCTSQNWLEYTNHIEQNLHVCGGKDVQFTEPVMRLQEGNSVWIAVGGGRELHPHIRKVHTGAARIAFQTATCAGVELVRVVPVHMFFESHDQQGTSVLVELGEPVDITDGRDTESAEGRQAVRNVTKTVELRLAKLVNFVPVDTQADFGTKGSNGQGETKAAVAEWKQVRLVDVAVCLHAAGHENGAYLPWELRVKRVRSITQIIGKRGYINSRLSPLTEAFGSLCATAERLGFSIFRPPYGTAWDMPISMKAVAKHIPFEIGSGKKSGASQLASLRNFSYGAWQWAPVFGSLGGPSADEATFDNVELQVSYNTVNELACALVSELRSEFPEVALAFDLKVP